RALAWRRACRSVCRRLPLDETPPSRVALALAWDTREHTRVDSRRVRTRLPYTGPGVADHNHNHPRGDPTPSPDDARLTLRLCHAADAFDIGLLDQLIVG